MPLTAPVPHRALRRVVVVRLVHLTADDDELSRAETVLTPAELARARRGTPAVHRRRVLLRAALRSALADELGVAPGAVPVRTAPSGRPASACRASTSAARPVACSASSPWAAGAGWAST